MMQEVVGQVVTNIPEYPTTEDSRCHIPVPIEDRMCELVKGSSERDEQRWRHY